MNKHPLQKTIFVFTLLALFPFFAESARAGKITKSGCVGGPQALVTATNGSGAYVHPSAVSTFKCVLNGLENVRMPVAWVGGYGCRPIRTSNHPRGLAMDVNQYARDKTKPVVPRQPGVQVARSCNATSGAVWRNPDNGHFEMRSASRQQQVSHRQKNPRKVSHHPKRQKKRHVQRFFYFF